ncbi:hypothetical protein SAMN02745830_01032 [Streptomyces sp. Amel2xC10]|nr:hypothetical protein SAMN02745830_01032 [Streptomyces sp. Amel2xC10]
MTRTTPPLDVEAVFPELGVLRRGATRLHPRRGRATVRDSSVGGPLLWPADEPWPVCVISHRRGSGYRYSDVVREREILEGAWRRDPRGGPNAEEVDELAGFKRGRHAPHLADTDPVPMIAVAQLYRRDVTGLPDRGEGDLLQVFWCGFERYGDSRHDLHVELWWRHSADVASPLAEQEQPAPEVVGRRELVPAPCVLHPEEIVEHPDLMALAPSLWDRIDAWEGPEDDERPQYISDASIAPGWKVGGHVAWPLTGPRPLPCSVCGAELGPLLTVDHTEWDPSTRSWIPYEDQGEVDSRDGTQAPLGRGCSVSRRSCGCRLPGCRSRTGRRVEGRRRTTNSTSLASRCATLSMRSRLGSRPSRTGLGRPSQVAGAFLPARCWPDAPERPAFRRHGTA